MVISVGLVLTGYSAWATRHKERNDIRLEFDRRSKALVSTVEHGLGESRISLEDLGGLFDSIQEVEVEEFNQFAKGVIARKHGIHALEWIPRVPGEQREAFVAKARLDVVGFEDITEKARDGKFVTAGERDEYFPVHFLQPYEGNEDAIGFDLLSSPVRSAALLAARDQGVAVATAPVTLVQEKGNQLGMLVFEPVYRGTEALTTKEARRRNLLGLALFVYRLRDLLASTVQHLPEHELGLVVTDTTDPEPTRIAVLGESLTNSTLGPDQPIHKFFELANESDIMVAGRRWTILCIAPPGFGDRFLTWNPWAALLVGIVLTGTVATYMLTLLGRTAHVQRLVADRTMELMEAKERAESADQAKNAFLGNVSHEIRTPIMAIIGAAELVAEDDGSDAENPPVRSLILRNARHLAALVDDLLDTSRVHAGRLDVSITDVSLHEILSDVHALASPTRGDRPIDFQIIPENALPDRISSDAVRLKQALINLVNNAFKNTRSGHIHVYVKANGEGDDSSLIFRVEDTGRGIASEDLDRIFEPFAQFASIPNSVSDGMGLGLPLARSIAKQLGGSLTVVSKLEKGSTFTLEVATGLPENARRTTMKPMIDEPPLTKLPTTRLFGHILLAEDFEDTLMLLKHAFQQAGATVTTAVNGTQAVQAAAREAFDLIVLDIKMPVMDGMRAASEIRSQGYLAPIVALTASVDPRERDRVLAAGFDDVWYKPMSIDEIVVRVADYLRTDDDDGNPCVITGKQAGATSRMTEALASFEASLRARLDRIRACVEANDTKSACEILHQLVGAAGLHGRMPMSLEAARLLELSRDAKSSLRVEDLRKIEELAESKQHMSAWIDNAFRKT